MKIFFHPLIALRLLWYTHFCFPSFLFLTQALEGYWILYWIVDLDLILFFRTFLERVRLKCLVDWCIYNDGWLFHLFAKQRVLYHLFPSYSLLLVFFHSRLQKIIWLFRYFYVVHPQAFRLEKRTSPDLLQYLSLGFSLKRNASEKHLVKNDSHRPYVSLS